jgi:hypothetical protein
VVHSILNFIVGYSPTEQEKQKPDSKHEKQPLLTAEEHAVNTYVYIFITDDSSRTIHPKRNKLAAANFFHSPCQMVTGNERTAYTVGF